MHVLRSLALHSIDKKKEIYIYIYIYIDACVKNETKSGRENTPRKVHNGKRPTQNSKKLVDGESERARASKKRKRER